MSKASTPAERLKALGNAFHVAGKYKSAYQKYSEAIALDPANAILWANRAASSLAMKEYMDAASDAKKASELDPKYAKAWARHATASYSLSSFQTSMQSWNAALSCLPSDVQLTPEQESLKAEFEAGLKKAQEAMDKPATTAYSMPSGSLEANNMPWKRALAMEQELMTGQRMSSAWVILNAYKEFDSGMEILKKMKRTRVGDQLRAEGQSGAVVSISNGLLRDERVFHVDNMPDFFEKYSDQVLMEISMTKGWGDGGPKLVQEEALKRLKTSGWDMVRPALSTTVRGWIIRAFMQDSVEEGSPEFYRNAVEVLEWGARVWKDVPKSDRGAIFEPSFIRGVKRLHLKSQMKAYGKKGPDCGYSLTEIADYARALIAQTVAHPPALDAAAPIDFGFWASFWTYVKADALSILGWCFMQFAFETENNDTSMKFFAEAAVYYTKAAETFLKDDENYAYFLKIALEAHWWLNSPLSITLPMAKQIREAIPEIKKIWEFSPSSTKYNVTLRQALVFEAEFRKRISKGTATLETLARPEDMEPDLLRKKKEMARGK